MLKELLDELSILKCLYNESDFSGVSKHLFYKDGSLYTTNGKIFIEKKFTLDMNDFSVPLKEFNEVLLKIKTKEVEIKQTKEKIILENKKTKIELLLNNSLLEKINFPYKKKFQILPKDFISALNLTRFCINKDAVDMAGYLLIENNYIYATDKFRICSYSFKEKLSDMILPYDCLEILIKMNVNKYEETERFYIFQNEEGTTIGILKTEIQKLNFKKYQDIFEKENETKIELPEDIKENLELSNIFTQDNLLQKEIEFIIKNRKLICKSKNTIGSIETEIKIKSNIELSFFIHPIFLLEILSICKIMEVNGDVVIFRNEKLNYFFRVNKK